jgi:hypothetical protein
MFPQNLPTAVAVKSTAKASLKGKNLKAGIVAATLTFAFFAVFFGVLGILQFADGNFVLSLTVLSATYLLVLHPLVLGAIRYFWRLTDGADDPPAELFYYFSGFALYKRALKCILLMLFKVLVAAFICMLPYLIVTLLSNSWIYQFLGTEIPLWVTRLALVQAFLYVAGTLATLLVISRYYLFPAIVVMDDDMLLLEAVHVSVMLSGRTAGNYLGLLISLAPMMLLSFLVMPLIYTVPLIFSCYAVHCRYAIVNYNLSLDFYNKPDYNWGF